MPIVLPSSSFGHIPPASFASTVLNDNPMGYWKLDDAAGPTAVDSSGNGRDGTYNNGTFNYQQVATPPPMGGTYLNVNPDSQAASLGPYVEMPSTAFDILGAPNQEYSLEAWVKIGIGIQNKIFIEKVESPSMNWASIHLAGNFGRTTDYDGTTSVSTDTLTNINDDAWHHIVGMRTTAAGVHGFSTMRIFLDGVPQTNTPINPANDSTTTADLAFFTRANGALANVFFIGDAAHFAVYDFALSDAQVLAHYNAAQ